MTGIRHIKKTAFALAVALVAASPIKGAFERWVGTLSAPAAAVVEGASYLLALALLALSLLSLSGGGYNPFIYFRF